MRQNALPSRGRQDRRGQPPSARPSAAVGQVRSLQPNSVGWVRQGDHVAAARAVYDASADRYVKFAGTELSSATEAQVDHSLLTAFVDLVAAGTVKRVADVGCGPGRVAAFLAMHGLDAVGLDVSAAMLAAARIAHPDIQFEEGQLDDLPIDEGSLGGVVCWYSIIYTPPECLGDVFAELVRVLSRGGYLLLAFQAGSGEPVHRTDAHRTGLSLTGYRHPRARYERPAAVTVGSADQGVAGGKIPIPIPIPSKS